MFESITQPWEDILQHEIEGMAWVSRLWPQFLIDAEKEALELAGKFNFLREEVYGMLFEAVKVATLSLKNSVYEVMDKII